MNFNIKTNNEKIREKIIFSFEEILRENRLLSLSTVNRQNAPSICTVYYAYDDKYNLYYWSEKTAEHSKNVEKNSKIALSIADTSQTWGSMLKGLKIYGIAKEARGMELMNGGKEYLKRFAKVKDLMKNIRDFNSKKFSSKLYKIEIEKAVILDEKRFGKENYQELIISR